MSALGPYLSHRREERGLSIEEVARVTRVAPRYLEALEREDFAALPAPVFTKGYIRAYCQALGVSVDEALTRYSESANVVVPTPAAAVVPPAPRTSENGRRSRGTLLVSFVLLVGFGLALFAMALFLQSGRPEIGSRRAEAPRLEPGSPRRGPGPELSAPGPAAIPAPDARRDVASAPPTTQTPAVVSASRPQDPKPAIPAQTRPAADASETAGAVASPPPLRLGSVVSPYRLVARTSEPTWLRVRTEDGRATEETIPPGEVREWISNRPFVLTIGNAAGIALELNGQKLPPLGGHGVVIRRLLLPPAEP
jgi:cytoskeleton protein RodZ